MKNETDDLALEVKEIRDTAVVTDDVEVNLKFDAEGRIHVTALDHQTGESIDIGVVRRSETDGTLQVFQGERLI